MEDWIITEGHLMQYLYWTHIKMMRTCPRQFLWTKGHPLHDLGAGLGKPKPLPPESERQSEHNLLMGSVLSRVVEDLYNHEMWKDPKALSQSLNDLALKEFEIEEKKRYLLWDYMTREEAIKVCTDGAQNFLRIMKENRLLGQWNKSEMKMTPALNKYASVCGIADLVYRDSEGGIHILDGKNAMTPGKYEDADQLRWYALCFRLQYGVLPVRLGFFYFRYPSTNPPSKIEGYTVDKWTGMLDVSLDMEDIKRLGKEAVETSKAINRGVFEPNPVPKHCSMCAYEPLCEERQAQKKHNAAKRGMGKTDSPDPTTAGSGIIDFSFKG